LCLFTEGDHTRTRTVMTNKVGGLTAFTKLGVKCLSCKAVLSSNLTAIPGQESPVCSHCEGKIAEVYQREVCVFDIA
jgi:DNA polymerase delta subunit 1